MLFVIGTVLLAIVVAIVAFKNRSPKARGNMWFVLAVCALLAAVAIVAGKNSTASPFTSRSQEEIEALDKILVDDDWLMHCAGHAEQYAGSFDTWWRLTSPNCTDEYQEKFRQVRPHDAVPSSGEIGKRLRELRKTHRVGIVGHKLVRGADRTDTVGKSGAFTPGPWESDEEVKPWMNGDSPAVAVWYTSDVQKDDDGNVISEGHSPVCMVAPDGHGRGGPAGSQNPLEDARLIAQAPAMYAELQRLASEQNWPDDHPAREILKRAIVSRNER